MLSTQLSSPCSSPCSNQEQHRVSSGECKQREVQKTATSEELHGYYSYKQMMAQGRSYLYTTSEDVGDVVEVTEVSTLYPYATAEYNDRKYVGTVSEYVQDKKYYSFYTL